MSFLFSLIFSISSTGKYTYFWETYTLIEDFPHLINISEHQFYFIYSGRHCAYGNKIGMVLTLMELTELEDTH